MIDYLGLGLLACLAAAGAWLARRAWRLRRPWLRWGLSVALGLVTFVCISALALAGSGYARVLRGHPHQAAALSVSTTEAQRARGERLAQMCAGCHARGGAFVGQNFSPGGLGIGTLYAANLTPTHLAAWTDGEIIRAIREGVGRDGRSLLLMPSDNYRRLSDSDVQALVAYLRSLPPASPDTPPTRVGVLGAALLNVAPIFSVQPPIDGPVAMPALGTPAYGQYLLDYSGCADCHGAALAGGGGEGPGPTPGPPLHNLAERWSEEAFLTAMRTGRRPGGGALSDAMPWQQIGAMATDDELRAMYAYLRTLQAPADAP